MSQPESSVGAVGLVRVGDLEVTVAPLPQAEEIALDRELRRAAEAHYGDHYTRCKPVLDAMKESPADRLEAVREIVRLAAAKAPLSAAALHEYRISEHGLAIELYARGKRATPGLDRKGLAAVVTAANADAVAAALFELLDDTKSAAG
jgi:hypothetical protein